MPAGRLANCWRAAPRSGRSAANRDNRPAASSRSGRRRGNLVRQRSAAGALPGPVPASRFRKPSSGWIARGSLLIELLPSSAKTLPPILLPCSSAGDAAGVRAAGQTGGRRVPGAGRDGGRAEIRSALDRLVAEHYLARLQTLQEKAARSR